MILAGGHYKQTQNNYIIAAIINIVISILFVNILGLAGVAIGTLLAMFYQTIWMAIYDSKNLIHWPIKYFIKQLLVDGITVLFFVIIAKFSTINEITWISWILYSIKVSIISLVFMGIINAIFYKKYIIAILKKLKRY